MNLRLLAKQLGIISMLIGAAMVFSLPWAHPTFGHRNDLSSGLELDFEWSGFLALLVSMVVCFTVGGILMWQGRQSEGHLFRKEAMAVVGLSWIMATVLGGLPFLLSGTYRSSSVRIVEPTQRIQVYDFRGSVWGQWITKQDLTASEVTAVASLVEAGAKGLDHSSLRVVTRESAINGASSQEPGHGADAVLRGLAARDLDWAEGLLFPGDSGPSDRRGNFRIRWIRMNLVDSFFESQSGFSTTGATVMSDLEDPHLVPHSILFWRSSTHFLGGLGIIVLFVAILGQGSAGKALMRAEMPGPSKEGSQARTQHTAWVFAALYVGLTAALTALLKAYGLSWFDGLCHAFATMATGGFSTYNASLGHFQSAAIEFTVIAFMILAGTNFTLLYFLLIGRPGTLIADLEWRTYIAVILAVTALVIVFGMVHHDFARNGDSSIRTQFPSALRYGLFQVVSIMTTTGFGTHDFDAWNSFGRGVLFLLMFVGGCAGSTGGGLKVIRHILFVKILGLEMEHAFHPSVVRPLRLGGKPVEDPNLRNSILVYFGLIALIFVLSWILLIIIEPDSTWGGASEHKLIDSASGVAATMNNIGPGLGTVGATQNYGHFSSGAKILFTWLMMVGRVEIFVILVLFMPGFWRTS